MSGEDPSGALRDIRTLFSEGMVGGLTDRQLLERFVKRDDASREAAFAILLQRHGPMVWGVCRRALADRHAAADAFQATFLVLVRRASAVRVDDSLGRWLYGVSRRVAARARATSLRRAARETAGAEEAAGRAPEPGDAEGLAVLDEEIGRLPEHHRAAVILCDLEGLPHEEAARRLGCPVGTVESRLSRARQRLRERLSRRGLAPAAAALCAEMAREASAAMPAALVHQTARLVTNPASVNPVVVNLARGAIRMIWLARLKPLAAVAAVAVLATAGVGVLGQQQPATKRADPEPGTTARPTGKAAGAGAPALAAGRALAREQLALIDKAEADLRRLAQGGEIHFSDPSFSMWGRRRLEALRAADAGKAEIVAALEKYLESMKKDEALVLRMYQQDSITRAQTYDVQYRRIEAEIWLNQERAR